MSSSSESNRSGSENAPKRRVGSDNGREEKRRAVSASLGTDDVGSNGGSSGQTVKAKEDVLRPVESGTHSPEVKGVGRGLSMTAEPRATESTPGHLPTTLGESSRRRHSVDPSARSPALRSPRGSISRSHPYQSTPLASTSHHSDRHTRSRHRSSITSPASPFTTLTSPLEANRMPPEESATPRRSVKPTWTTSEGPAHGGDDESTLRPASSISSSSRHNIPHSASVPTRLSSPATPYYSASGQSVSNPPQKVQSAFVGKLYAMLQDDDITRTGLIHWSADGSVFTCPNPTEFARLIIPRYFKHNNWQSFVRQLNMYSFNKVNDLFATSTDPGAWEFRHPLFRRGEPQLLAQIKRKPTRQSAGQEIMATSPPDELDISRPVAGWMRDSGYRGSVLQPTSEDPPQLGQSSGRVPGPSSGGPVVGYNLQTGEAVSARPVGERIRLHHWDPSPSTSRAPHSYPEPASTIILNEPSSGRYHSEPNRLAFSSRFALTPAASGAGSQLESPYYSQPPSASSSSLQELGQHVTDLEDKVQRLHELLNSERVENVRNNIDFTSYLLQVTSWIGSGQPPSGSELHALQDMLSRASTSLRHQYEALMASGVVSLPSGEQHPSILSSSALPAARRSTLVANTPRSSPMTHHPYRPESRDLASVPRPQASSMPHGPSTEAPPALPFRPSHAHRPSSPLPFLPASGTSSSRSSINLGTTSSLPPPTSSGVSTSPHVYVSRRLTGESRTSGIPEELEAEKMEVEDERPKSGIRNLLN